MFTARIKSLFIIAISGLVIAACQPAGNQGGTAGSLVDIPTVVAKVGEEKITAAELNAAAAGQLSRLRAQVYQIYKMTLDGLIGEKLVTAAAKKDGKTVEEYIKQEIDAKVMG